MIKYSVSHSELLKICDVLHSTLTTEKAESFNVIYLKTNNGIIKLKTDLTLEEWLSENKLKPKKK